MVSGSVDHCVRFWDPQNASLGFVLEGHQKPGPFPCLVIHQPSSSQSLLVVSVDLSPMGGLFATGSRDHLARICTYAFANLLETI